MPPKKIAVDLRRIRKLIEAAGYTGPQEVEILSTDLWKRPGDELIKTCIDRYNAFCRTDAV